MTMKNIVAALACCSALAVAGCGGDDDKDTSASSKPAQTTAQSQTTEPASSSGGGETSADGIARCLRDAGYVVEDSDTNFTLTSLNEGQPTDDIHALELELPKSAKSGASMEIFVFKDQALADDKLETVKALSSIVEQRGNAVLAYGQDYNKDIYKKAPGCIAA